MKILKNIFGNKEAGVKIVSIAVVIIIIALALAVYFLVASGSSEYWEDSFAGGEWGQEIFLQYEDGTLQSVKDLITDSDKLAVYYDSPTPVTGLTYKLSAKASGGSGSETVRIDKSGFGVYLDALKQPQNTNVGSWSFLDDGTVTINVDNSWHVVTSWSLNKISDILPDSLADGAYMVVFKPDGILKYKIGSGDYQIADNPGNVALNFVKSGGGGGGGEIVVTFGGTAGVKY